MFLKSCAAAEHALKIENETFNTLKNQGYNFEHNYGHGNENLSVFFALLMIATRFWLIRRSNLPVSYFKLFGRSWGVKEVSLENIRYLFFGFKVDSMKDILRTLLYGFKRDCPVILEDPPPS